MKGLGSDLREADQDEEKQFNYFNKVGVEWIAYQSDPVTVDTKNQQNLTYGRQCREYYIFVISIRLDILHVALAEFARLTSVCCVLCGARSTGPRHMHKCAVMALATVSDTP